jgi:hypothetical protein
VLPAMGPTPMELRRVEEYPPDLSGGYQFSGAAVVDPEEIGAILQEAQLVEPEMPVPGYNQLYCVPRADGTVEYWAGRGSQSTGSLFRAPP